MKWTLPISIGAVFAACLTYLHVAPAPKADSTACCVSGTSGETASCCSQAASCCSEGAACCAADAACCETAANKADACPCYVISETSGLADAMKCIDVWGQETVDDLLTKASAALDLDGKDAWISRLGKDAVGPEQILRVNFLDMSEGIDPAMNYQIIPYDRIFIDGHESDLR